MASMTQPPSKRRTGAAPTAPEVRAFVRTHWLKNAARNITSTGAADRAAQLRSIERMTALVAATFANVYRDHRPAHLGHAESTFWHNWRVAEAVRQNTKQNLLSTFAAFGHDLVEDTRKRPPRQRITIADIARLWTRQDRPQQKRDRALLADTLHLKTDAAGLKGTKRRAAQLQRVESVRAGRHGQAGKLFVKILYADKHDNLLSDMADLRAGYLQFASAKQLLDHVRRKKTHDLTIVNHMPIPIEQIKKFYWTYKKLAVKLLSNDALIASKPPALKRVAAQPVAPRSYAQRSQRIIKSLSAPRRALPKTIVPMPPKAARHCLHLTVS